LRTFRRHLKRKRLTNQYMKPILPVTFTLCLKKHSKTVGHNNNGISEVNSITRQH